MSHPTRAELIYINGQQVRRIAQLERELQWALQAKHDATRSNVAHQQRMAQQANRAEVARAQS